MSTDQNAQNENQVTTQKGNKPVETLRDGALKLSIFRNQRENGVSFSMQPGRIYTDSQGHVRESASLSGSEPIRMAKLLDKGYDRVADFKAQMKAQTQDMERER